ncbi:hypothetical protein F511_38168 [Dorcoceras hygrometricum]|uniref:Uncharacterized protein n=1 Tax=Dorcoceras hygrometricum TaxID=472368 RepID=A0A2Z7C7I4_9LAMI|nr:hypothetical protein F511_38168 [Dorcoceras hygrometricum]
MVIGSLATLDLPMVADLIGIYVLKGPYCTLTMTDWFLQALSVIPRGSWGDVARRFTYDPMEALGIHLKYTKKLLSLFFLSSPLLAAAAARRRRKSRFDRFSEEIPSVKSSSSFLVQIGEGIEIPIVDRIRRPKSINRVLTVPGLHFLNLPLRPRSGIRIRRCANKSSPCPLCPHATGPEADDLRRSFDDASEHFTELQTWLAEVEAARAEEARVAEMHSVALEIQGLRLEAKKAALLSEKKALAAEKEALEAEKGAMMAELDETKVERPPEGALMRSEIRCRAGRAYVLKIATREGASAELGFSAQVGLPPEEVPVRNWALSAELVGLMCLRRRATRESASAELGFSAQVGLPPEEVLVRNWALSTELVGLMCLHRRAT